MRCQMQSHWTGSGRQAVSNRFDHWLTKRRLRGASHFGAGARLDGFANVGGGGELIIGDGFLLLSRPARSHIWSAPGAAIRIGNGVRISYGAAIAALRSIDIGSHTTLGPFAVIMDNDFHKVGNRNAAGEIAPVRIGSNVNIGARVTILRGSVIGDNVRVMSGSMVSGVVPEGVTIGGVPARVLTTSNAAVGQSIDMAALVQGVLGLAERPHPGEGPAEIAAWDSLGSLRLLLAIEETCGVSIDEREMHAGNTVAALAAIVESKLNGAALGAVDLTGPV
jgi:acetyltransferase-like isoleucine patch superfamily enzyme/acyl carrier protein